MINAMPITRTSGKTVNNNIMLLAGPSDWAPIFEGEWERRGEGVRERVGKIVRSEPT